MLALFRDLFEHQAYADAAMLNAIRRHEAAARDEPLRTLLHHTLLAHRFWLHLSQGLPFVPEDESKVPESLDTIATRYRDTQARERQWLAEIQDSDLNRLLESPFFEGKRYTVRDGLLQVCLHSQGHRSQCASKLRALGGEPPSLDYVLWIKDGRPAPAWPD
ncbi:MAG: DinB family protein [Acidobacteria bacterium]|nr:DinB family protein [Acidobacteriota bacterium]